MYKKDPRIRVDLSVTPPLRGAQIQRFLGDFLKTRNKLS